MLKIKIATCYLLLLLMSACNCSAKTYYVSATGSDTNDGFSSAKAWKTIAKINTTIFLPGDAILFKSGDTFFGTLEPVTNNIVFSNYGEGTKPVITGLVDISDWKSLGGNIWEAAVPDGLPTLNMVLIKGMLTPMGRYPNANTANGGYNTYETYVNNSAITDNQLSGTPNFSGADVVIRKADYATVRTTINSHEGTTLNFNIPQGVSFTNGYGYFIENSLATLDQNGEWFYDNATKKIQIYNTGKPPVIQVATQMNLVNMPFSTNSRKSNVSFKGLSFKGSEGALINITYCDNITIDNCTFSFAGTGAIEHRNMTNFKIQNCFISDANMLGIHEMNPGTGDNITIQNNTIRRIGIYAGMISKNKMYNEGASSTAINIGASNLLIQENTIDSVGYIGISLVKTRNNQIVRKNSVSNFCFIKNDGAGIYNSGLRGDALPTTNPIFESNIVFNSLNAGFGTTNPNSPHVRGIYLDASSSNINILNNTIFHCYEGIYLSHAQNIVIRGNTLYDVGNYKPSSNYFSGQISILDASEGFQHVRNNIITNNIFFSKYPYQLPYYQDDRYDGVDKVGTIDSNYYASPMNDFPLFITNTTASSKIDLYSFDQWKTKFVGYDLHSKVSPVKVPSFKSTVVGSNKMLNSSFKNNVDGLTASSKPTVHTLTWDGSKQITGNGSAKLTSNVASSNFTNITEVVGAVSMGKEYILKFKTKAEKPGSFKTYLQQWTGDYSIITPVQSGVINAAVQQHEIAFKWDKPSQTNAAVIIQFSQDNSTTYISDAEFYEAKIKTTDPEEYIRFEYNNTDLKKIVKLDAKYMDVKGNMYSNNLTLSPYSSVVLIRQ